MRFLRVFLLGWVLLVSASAGAQSNLVLLVSSPGEPIGQGGTYVTTNGTDFTVSGTAATVQIAAFGYTVTFDGPDQSNLMAGRYSNAVLYPFNGSAPGLDVFGYGRGCGSVCGDFQVLEIQTNAAAQVAHFWVTFSLHCNCGAPTFSGDIRYNSLVAPPAALPRKLRVPADFPTIQAAINDANVLVADTVFVAPGTYFEYIDFRGKALTVVSEKGPEATIIDGKNSGSIITFGSHEGRDSVLCGFTIQNGVQNVYAGGGGAITVGFSSPTIVSNVFRNNQQGFGIGAAIGCNGSSPLIAHNLFMNNNGYDLDSGGGVISFINASSPLIANNVFEHNACRAIDLELPGGNNPNIINNTIVSNTVGIRIAATYQVGGLCINNLLAGNAVGLDFSPPASDDLTWAHNLVYGGQNYVGIPDQTGTNGNISADPSFTCQPGQDFHLLASSPCIDAGTNIVVLLPETDFDGRARVTAGQFNGQAVVDMGAFEFDPSNPPAPCLFLYCPSNMLVIAAPGQDSATVNYGLPFATPGATVSNLPPSGSVFPIGDDAVAISATYGTNVLNCTFTITVLSAYDFTRALNTTNATWTTNGDLPWVVQQTLTHDGVLAAQSGKITNSQTSALETALIGPGTLSYWWKVSSEKNHDFVHFKIGGITQSSISGEVDWQQLTMYLGAGPQSLQWVYAKDGSGDSGQDAGWVDQVNYSPGATAPIITAQPISLAVLLGQMATFSVGAVGTPPFSYQWQFNGTNIEGATEASLTATNVQSANIGNYNVVVSNVAGSTNSATATLGLPELVAWGANSYGQTNVPPEAANIIAIAGGWHHSVALRANGTAVAWGLNDKGQTNVPAGLTNAIAISSRSGDHVVALKQDGTVVTWGDNFYSQRNVPAGTTNVVAISAGGLHSLVLKADGNLVTWGFYVGSQRARVPVSLSNAVAISAGDYVSLALKPDGTVTQWGSTSVPQPPPGLSNVVMVAAGGLHNLALKADGQVVAWGNNENGQTNVPAGLSNVIAITAGDYHSLALKADGTAVAWGQYFTGNSFVPAEVPVGITNLVAIAAGSDHDLAIVGKPVPLATLANASFVGNSFSVSLPTQSGRVYRLEYTDSLTETNWMALPLAPGNGSSQTLIDSTVSSAQRFYRVPRW